jgi:hypothetical protein
MADKDDAVLLEGLASVFHDAWWHWSESVAPDIKDPERVARWKEFWVAYDALDESTKDLDRKWAEEALKKIKPYLDKAKMAKEMVTKVEVDSNKYPGVSNVLASEELSMEEDLSLPLLVDALLSELESEKNEDPKLGTSPESIQEMLDGIQYPQAEMTETMPDFFDDAGVDWKKFLPTKLIKNMIADVDRNWAGKATVKELYDFDPHAAHGLVMGLVGHGVSADDDKEAADWLKKRGVNPRGSKKYYESPYDEAFGLIDAYEQAKGKQNG